MRLISRGADGSRSKSNSVCRLSAMMCVFLVQMVLLGFVIHISTFYPPHPPTAPFSLLSSPLLSTPPIPSLRPLSFTLFAFSIFFSPQKVLTSDQTCVDVVKYQQSHLSNTWSCDLVKCHQRHMLTGEFHGRAVVAYVWESKVEQETPRLQSTWLLQYCTWKQHLWMKCWDRVLFYLHSIINRRDQFWLCMNVLFMCTIVVHN